MNYHLWYSTTCSGMFTNLIFLDIIFLYTGSLILKWCLKLSKACSVVNIIYVIPVYSEWREATCSCLQCHDVLITNNAMHIVVYSENTQTWIKHKPQNIFSSNRKLRVHSYGTYKLLLILKKTSISSEDNVYTWTSIKSFH